MTFHANGHHVNRHLISVLMIATLGSLTYGFTAAVISAAIAQPSFIARMGITAANESRIFGAINGVFQGAGILSCLATPWVSDKYGRKAILYIGAFFNILGAGLQAGSVDIAMFLVARFVSGAGAYMLLGSLPLWMCEIVPPGLRGTLMDLHGVFIIFGYAIAGWIEYGFFFWQNGASGNQWRAPLAFQAIWPILFAALLPRMPQSPRWLVLHGQNERALAILERLHSTKSDPDHTFARAEFCQIQKQTELEKKYTTSWTSMLTKPSYRKRTLIALSTTVFVSSSGILVVANYFTVITKTLGYDSQRQILLSTIGTMVSWVSTMLSMLVVDRVPRPKFIGFLLFLCAACLSVEAALVKHFVGGTTNNPSALRAAIAMLFLFEVSFGFGLDATQFTYISEIFPSYLRAKGTAIGTLGVPVANLLWLEIAPVAFAEIGWRTYLIFICLGSVGAGVLFFIYPDTKGIPLEEIAAIFGDANEVAVYQRELEGMPDATEVGRDKALPVAQTTIHCEGHVANKTA